MQRTLWFLVGLVLAGCVGSGTEAPASVPVSPGAGTPGEPMLAVTAPGGETPAVRTADRTPTGGPLGRILALCARATVGDVVFLSLPGLGSAFSRPPELLQIFRAPVAADGTVGPVTVFADLWSLYEGEDARAYRLACHPDTGRILVSVRNAGTVGAESSWDSELRLLHADGRLAVDHGLAREIGPSKLAWSPDGRSLLVEASPYREAGRTYRFDLATERADRVDDHVAFTDAGASVADLFWSDDGRTGVIESYSSIDAITATMQLVDVSALTPTLLPARDLPGAVAFAPVPGGGLVFLAQESDWDEDATRLAVRTWDPSRPEDGPAEIGRIPAIRPPGAAMDLIPLPSPPGNRFVFRLVGAGANHLYLADLSDPDAPVAWRLLPLGTTVRGVDLLGDLLIVRVEPAGDAEESVTNQLRVLALADLAPNVLPANPAFEQIGPE